MKLVIRVESYQNFGYNFIISMTLLIVPFFGDAKRFLSVNIIDSQRNLISKVDCEGEQKLILELFLIFAMPFYWPFSEKKSRFRSLK